MNSLFIRIYTQVRLWILEIIYTGVVHEVVVTDGRCNESESITCTNMQTLWKGEYLIVFICTLPVRRNLLLLPWKIITRNMANENCYDVSTGKTCGDIRIKPKYTYKFSRLHSKWGTICRKFYWSYYNFSRGAKT